MTHEHKMRLMSSSDSESHCSLAHVFNPAIPRIKPFDQLFHNCANSGEKQILIKEKRLCVYISYCLLVNVNFPFVIPPFIIIGRHKP